MRFAALLLVASLASCGGATQRPPGHDDDTYRFAAYRILDRYVKEKTKFDETHVSVERIHRSAARQHAALKRVADGLAALHPPPRLRRLHDDAVVAFRKEAQVFASIEGDAATARSMKELNTRMWLYGDRLARIKDEVDTAAERYFKALG